MEVYSSQEQENVDSFLDNGEKVSLNVIPPSQEYNTGISQTNKRKLENDYESHASKVFIDNFVTKTWSDGCSNIHNKPIFCGVVTNNAGDTFLVNSINTSGHPHTSKYLVEVAKFSFWYFN